MLYDDIHSPTGTWTRDYIYTLKGFIFCRPQNDCFALEDGGWEWEHKL